MTETLNHHHRDTVEKIFNRPESSNIEWRQVLSLLETVGTVTQKRDGAFQVIVGPETDTLRAPHDKDVDVQMLVDLRRMLKQAGYEPGGPAATPDTEARDHGDGQWGEPN